MFPLTSVERSVERGEGRRAVLGGLIALATVAAAIVLLVTRKGDAAPALSLVIGAALGVAFERGRFCFYCIFREVIQERKMEGVQAVLVALAVGAVGYAYVFGLYLPNSQGEGLPPLAHISPVSGALVIGGLSFGLGMVLSGACISGHIYRIGQGYLRAIPALLGSLIGFGIGFMTWNWFYLRWITESPTWWLPRSLGYVGSLAVLLGVLAAVSMAMRRRARSATLAESGHLEHAASPQGVLRGLLSDRLWSAKTTGVVVGLLGVMAYLRLSPLGVTSQLSGVSRTILNDQGALPEVMHGIDVMKGCVGAVVTTVTNNGWLIIGLALASFASAVFAGRFRPQIPSLASAMSALLGGVFLGWGSMTALGCTVGVLLSGTQALSLSGPVFLLALLVGMWIGLRLRLNRFG
jgi:uncharacterized membrane protein YedE/YeeE